MYAHLTESVCTSFLGIRLMLRLHLLWSVSLKLSLSKSSWLKTHPSNFPLSFDASIKSSLRLFFSNFVLSTYSSSLYEQSNSYQRETLQRSGPNFQDCSWKSRCFPSVSIWTVSYFQLPPVLQHYTCQLYPWVLCVEWHRMILLL